MTRLNLAKSQVSTQTKETGSLITGPSTGKEGLHHVDWHNLLLQLLSLPLILRPETLMVPHKTRQRSPPSYHLCHRFTDLSYNRNMTVICLTYTPFTCIIFIYLPLKNKIKQRKEFQFFSNFPIFLQSLQKYVRALLQFFVFASLLPIPCSWSHGKALAAHSVCVRACMCVHTCLRTFLFSSSTYFIKPTSSFLTAPAQVSPFLRKFLKLPGIDAYSLLVSILGL